MTAHQPKPEAFRTTTAMVNSTIMVPFEITTAEVTRLLNQNLRTELYKGATSTRGVSVTVTRNGAIAVTAADNYLYLTLPVAMSLSSGIFTSKTIPLTLRFKVAVGVTPDWQLHTEVYYLGLSDLLAEEIGIGPFSFRPRSIVDTLTQPVQKLLSAVVAQKVNTLLPLKSTVATAWQSMQTPLRLDDKFDAWLFLTPRAVMMYPLSAHNNRLRTSIGVAAGARIVTGSRPAPPAPAALPDITLVNNFDKNFRVTIQADFPYQELRTIATPLLLNRTFSVDGRQVTVKEFDLYGNGDKIVVKLLTTGSLEGTFYLTAKPVFDPQTSTLAVTDVDFDLQTRDLLLASADWFLHGTICSTLQEKLNTKLTTHLEQLRSKAEKELAKIPLSDTIFITGRVTTLSFKDLVVQQHGLALQMHVEGETTLVMP